MFLNKVTKSFSLKLNFLLGLSSNIVCNSHGAKVLPTYASYYKKNSAIFEQLSVRISFIKPAIISLESEESLYFVIDHKVYNFSSDL